MSAAVDPAREFEVDATTPTGAVALLRRTRTIRDRAQVLLERARRGESEWFAIGTDDELEDAARAVAETTRERYPWNAIALHSRWRHFEAGGVDRKSELDDLLGEGATRRERARAQIDLVVISVLLDAGAGADWHYVESASGQRFSRSEGLAVASFHAFSAGLFSSDPKQPMQVDAKGLRALVTDRLAEAFQASDANPLLGLAGRAILLRRLGETMAERPAIFGPDGRPGFLLDAVMGPLGPALPPTAMVTAHDILDQVLQSFAGIWPAQNAIDSVSADGRAQMGSGDPALALGDCWRHSAVRGPGQSDGWMPFHKLSQWLTYSLLEPFSWAGVNVTGLEALTGLPEYRNGGLFIDTGVIIPKDPHSLERVWQVGDEFIVEWRALTVALLDELAARVRKNLTRDEVELPLACILEGGTWAAGRALAQRLRDGAPPIRIESDGTVF
ncbi:MAG: URC4/urg3 family protein [Variovorax sp.]